MKRFGIQTTVKAYHVNKRTNSRREAVMSKTIKNTIKTMPASALAENRKNNPIPCGSILPDRRLRRLKTRAAQQDAWKSDQA